MTNATCFTRDELRSYLLGELPEPASGEVALHVELCASCEATVTQLDRESDTLIESLRQPVSAEDAPVSAYRLAAKRAIAHWQQSIQEDTEDTGQAATDAPRLRDYELLELLARGGMGTVYRARHLRLNRQVALKVLPGRLLEDPAVVARFEREMQAVGSLRHPAIVQATDGGEAEGVHFLVMELIDGCDAGAMVQHLGPLPVADACEIARQAAVGMAYVHQQGIIHRDLKPSNLMVTMTGEVKVLDLGLARVVGEQLTEDELTTVGQLMGTLDFMAPEQVENSHDVDERTDIYALGGTLYKLLTGRAPHTTDTVEPLLSKLRRITSEPSAPLKERLSNAPVELCELVDRMLSHNATDRPDSMESIAESLGSLCGSNDLLKRVNDAVALRQQQMPSETSSSLFSSVHTTSKAKSVQRQELPVRSASGQRWLAWVAAALLMLAAAMGIVITLQTTAGQLIIETATPDVEVRVLRAGQAHRQLTLKQNAESLRLGAGEYEIEIVSDADGLEIENGTFTLKRGETWLARIVHRNAASETSTTNYQGGSALSSGSQVPTYEDRTLAQWLSLLHRERSAKQLYDACKALDKLATGDQTVEAVEALLVAIRVHDSQTRYQKESGEAFSIWDSVRLLLATRDQGVVVPALIAELDRRDEANHEFILEYLLQTNHSVGPFVNEQLLAHVERLATDDKSQVRIQAISVLRALSSDERATRRLVAALSDREVHVQLFAARALIEMQSNTPLVVSTLRRVVGSGELRDRAEAAWRLGDLGSAAQPAIPELTAIVQSDDDSISRAAAFQTPYKSISVGGFGGLGMASVKDAAIRALAEIGDASVVDVLIVEWERRASGDNRPSDPTTAWSKIPGGIVANTYNADWVADAIEQLIGMEPTLEKRFDGVFTVWRIDGLTLERAYDTAFTKSLQKRYAPQVLEIAKRLMPRAHPYERDDAREEIASVRRAPKTHELELEVEMIGLLSASYNPRLVLESLLARWNRYAAIPDEEFEPGLKADVLAAYRRCAVQVLHDTKNWQKTDVAPHLLRLGDRYWPAGVLLMDVLTELEPPLQVDAVVRTLQLIAVHGTGGFKDSTESLAVWLDDDTHRAAIHSQLEQAMSDTWEDLVIGLLRAGLADDDVKQVLKTRFANDSINRSALLEKLVHSLSYQPDLTQLVIDLIEHPALDAPASVLVRGNSRTEISLRAALYLKELVPIATEHRRRFIPLLQRLVQSGKNGESDAAREVLEAWK